MIDASNLPATGESGALNDAGISPESLAHAAHSFHSFSITHGVTFLVCAILVIASCTLGRLWRRAGTMDTREGRLSTAWGGFVLGVNLWSWVYWMLPNRFDARESLPLQLCDIGCVIAGVAYLTKWRWPKAIIYFWGMGLSTQAFITPTLKFGPGHMEFWLFWLVHLSIVGSAIYQLVVHRYRPTTRDLVLTIVVSMVWVGAMLGINAILGSNYGYVGNTTPERPTIIDSLGPWPGRVFILIVIANTIFLALWAIWRPWKKHRTLATSHT